MPTQEFQDAVAQAIAEVRQGQTELDRAYTDQISFYTADAPGDVDYQTTGADHDSVLLAKYEWQPVPSITMYESSLSQMAPHMGGMHAALKDTLWHEIYQHHFGMDHTKETIEAGYTPALWLHPTPSGAACVSCQGSCNVHASPYGAYPPEAAANVSGNVGYPESGYDYSINPFVDSDIYPYLSPYYTPEFYTEEFNQALNYIPNQPISQGANMLVNAEWYPYLVESQWYP